MKKVLKGLFWKSVWAHLYLCLILLCFLLPHRININVAAKMGDKFTFCVILFFLAAVCFLFDFLYAAYIIPRIYRRRFKNQIKYRNDNRITDLSELRGLAGILFLIVAMILSEHLNWYVLNGAVALMVILNRVARTDKSFAIKRGRLSFLPFSDLKNYPDLESMADNIEVADGCNVHFDFYFIYPKSDDPNTWERDVAKSWVLFFRRKIKKIRKDAENARISSERSFVMSVDLADELGQAGEK
jgi:hypothetical protein